MPNQSSSRHAAVRTPPTSGRQQPRWIDVPTLARVHASSEAAGCPVTAAFTPTRSVGWRAADPGAQVVTVQFHRPRDLSRVLLVFESDDERTQEFVISWSSARRGAAHGEVVRQQFNFSRQGATREIEDYRVELYAIETLQIRITPDIGGGPAVASLKACWLV